MVSQHVKVINPSGLHLRPASVLSKIAADCKSDVALIKGEKRVNPKSVLFLMGGNILCGDEIIVECTGQSEAQDLAVIVQAIESGLGEMDE